jgi:hypothetical protein
MKEDYLWDKTGTDPAIQKLENALSVFQFDESSLQMPVSAHVPAEGRRRYFRFLSFGFAAAAACLVVAVISWVLLGRAFNPDKGPIQEQVLTQLGGTTLEGPPAVDRPDSPVSGEVKPPARTAGHNIKAPGKPVRPVAVTARAKRRLPAAETFTREEIYAYNQLVLALSITSDKLNLVKEKIPGE